MQNFKKLEILGILTFLAFMAVPVMAQNQGDFHALSKFSTDLKPMANDELSAIEGGRLNLNIHLDIAAVTVVQANIAVLSEGGTQYNISAIGIEF